MKLSLIAALAFATFTLGQKVVPPSQFDDVQKQAISSGPIEKADADYSEEARIAELEGTVRIAGTVGEDGRPRDLRVLETLGLGLDERALETARQQSFDASALGLAATIEVRYHLPSKYSRWHLIHAEFQPPEGASRPQFLSANYPTGAGILSRAAVEEGRVLGAIGREGTAAIAFIINENGLPTQFQIINASANMWGQEAIAVLSEWHFKPATKDGQPVPAPAKFELAWGPRELNPQRIDSLRTALDPLPALQKTPAARIPLDIEIVIHPSSSQDAMDAKIQKTVLVSLVTREDGTPADLRVVDGQGTALEEKALEEVGQRRFKPVFVNGVFAPQRVTMQVDFRLK